MALVSKFGGGGEECIKSNFMFNTPKLPKVLFENWNNSKFVGGIGEVIIRGVIHNKYIRTKVCLKIYYILYKI